MLTVFRKAFAENDLVFVPGVTNDSHGKWVNLASVRWHAPPCLSNFVALQDLYPSQLQLFVTTLNVGEATVSDIVDRLEQLSGHVTSLSDIKALLEYLNTKTTQKVFSQSIIDRLLRTDLRVIPVRTGSVVTLRSAKDVTWFVADTTILRRSFEGKLALLDFDMINSASLKPLMDKLGLQDRWLSGLAVERTEASGEDSDQPALTEILKSKAGYISL